MANDRLRGVIDPVLCLPVCHGASGEPHIDAIRQHPLREQR